MDKTWKKVGVTQLLTTTPGTCGIIKHTPQDFVVEEIQINNTITQATAFINGG
ncbi:MAG: tRNA pseudouridine(13) synthase TruD, partial [Candidatus Diapherotrites archaeon]|nr:tRNA pseudouridine(13) synthase TruD [Candidatus Diapherotrites archaeon]